MDTSTHTALQGCVASLRSSMQLLDSSITILDAGVSDYPRLASVLQTTRHFELVAEHDLVTAQSALLAEIQPEVSNLLGRVEAYLDKLERREQSLMAKAELQEGRLSQPATAHAARIPRQRSGSASGKNAAAGSAASKMEELRFQQLQQKKERLSYAVGRLELQASQRQRQLRKSMAAQ